MSAAMPPGCQELSDGIFAWDPVKDVSARKNASKHSSPDIILLFTWAEAQPRHYNKYLEGYQELFPTSRIILTRATTMKTFFAGQAATQEYVQGMVQREILPFFTSTDQAASKPRILAHCFSNSGALNMEAVIAVWHKTMGANTPPPLRMVILDSVPGGQSYITDFSRWTTGVALGINLPFVPKVVSWTLAAMVITVMMVIPQMLGIELQAVRGPRALNTPTIIPLESTRLYLYSTTDPLILYRAVDAHAEDAKAKGYKNVLLERFEGSMHVSHLKLDPERYWNAVWKAWNSSEGKQRLL